MNNKFDIKWKQFNWVFQVKNQKIVCKLLHATRHNHKQVYLGHNQVKRGFWKGTETETHKAMSFRENCLCSGNLFKPAAKTNNEHLHT